MLGYDDDDVMWNSTYTLCLNTLTFYIKIYIQFYLCYEEQAAVKHISNPK